MTLSTLISFTHGYAILAPASSLSRDTWLSHLAVLIALIATIAMSVVTSMLFTHSSFSRRPRAPALIFPTVSLRMNVHRSPNLQECRKGEHSWVEQPAHLLRSIQCTCLRNIISFYVPLPILKFVQTHNGVHFFKLSMD